jgi:hypothetical protein
MIAMFAMGKNLKFLQLEKEYVSEWIIALVIKIFKYLGITNYVGCDCQYPVCYGVPSFNNSCNNRGTCISANNCFCNNGYGGNQCEFFTCNNILSNNITVCNQKGNCTSIDQCNCNEKYTGQFCQIIKCFGISKIDPLVCNSKGNCIEIDTCSCNNGYAGEECQFNLCNNTLSNDIKVCSGYGSCIKPNYCACQSNVQGEFCDFFSCFGIYINDTQSICNGKGKCTKPDECTCESILYSGTNCSNNIYLLIIIISSVLSFLFIILISILIIIICCLSISFLTALIINYHKKNQTFKLKNKELSEKLNLMNDLNKININLIKFEKIKGNLVVIGKGASSIVYKGI